MQLLLKSYLVCLLLLFLGSIQYFADLEAISMVYNFRIAQVTKQPVPSEETEAENTFLVLLFDQYYKKHSDELHNFEGGLFSYIYNDKHYYFRTDGAVARVQQKKEGVVVFSDTQTDDVLFTFGRHFEFSDNKTSTLSVLFGIPTHRVFKLLHPDFGYGHMGTGIQLDGTYPLGEEGAEQDLLWGVRYIYYIPRRTQNDTGKRYSFTIGNKADLFLAYKKSIGNHGLEVGCTSRFLFGSHIAPLLEDITQRSDYIRSSFYAVYGYKFLVRDIPNRFLFSIGYGFDELPKYFGNKYILSLWMSWNVNF